MFMVMILDTGFRSRPNGRQRDDWLRGNTMVQSTRNYVKLDALQSNRYIFLCRLDINYQSILVT
jgi:hypothetical protein